MKPQLCTEPGCPFFGRYCRNHLSASEPKQTKLAKLSEKLKGQNKIYQKKRRVYLKDHPICEVEGCKEKSRDIHHRKGRTGELLTDENYFMACCRNHHSQIELNPAWARQNGYSESRLKKETNH